MDSKTLATSSRGVPAAADPGCCIQNQIKTLSGTMEPAGDESFPVKAVISADSLWHAAGFVLNILAIAFLVFLVFLWLLG